MKYQGLIREGDRTVGRTKVVDSEKEAYDLALLKQAQFFDYKKTYIYIAKAEDSEEKRKRKLTGQEVNI